MAANGWSFWTTHNNQRIVVYVANSDKDEAIKLALDYVGDFAADEAVGISEGVIRFIGLKPDMVKIAIVQEK